MLRQPALVLSGLLVGIGLGTSAHAAVLTVDCASGPYLTIQSAVTAASSGDTIVVHPCTPAYNENVVISGYSDLHLVAADAPPGIVGATKVGVGAFFNPAVVVDGTGLPGSCVRIDASTRVSLTGFKLQRCAAGVEVLGSDRVVTHGNRIQSQSFAGYVESGSQDTQVHGNLIVRNAYGVFLDATVGTVVADNRILSNTDDGILLGGDLLHVVNNDVSRNLINGIHSWFGSRQRIERNTAIGNTWGGGTANIFVEPGLIGVDIIGNDTAGLLIDLSGSDVAENL